MPQGWNIWLSDSKSNFRTIGFHRVKKTEVPPTKILGARTSTQQQKTNVSQPSHESWHKRVQDLNPGKLVQVESTHYYDIFAVTDMQHHVP